MFYIRDCNDNIVGNPNGYKTMRGAQAQTNIRKPASEELSPTSIRVGIANIANKCKGLP